MTHGENLAKNNHDEEVHLVAILPVVFIMCIETVFCIYFKVFLMFLNLLKLRKSKCLHEEDKGILDPKIH